MKNKKRICSILVSVLGMIALHATPNFTVDPAGHVNGFNNWDKAFIEGILLFGDSIYNWYFIAKSLAMFFCMLNIFFQALKLMLGMEQIKKVFIDLITKVLLFNVCITIYPLAIDKIVSLSSNWGLNATNVTSTLINELCIIYESSFQKAMIGRTKLEQMMTSGVIEELDQQSLRALSDSFSLTPEEIQRLMKDSTILDNKVNLGKKKNAAASSLLVGAGMGGGLAALTAVAGIALGPIAWIAIGAGAVTAAGLRYAQVQRDNKTIQQGYMKMREDYKADLVNMMNSKDITNALIIYRAFTDVLGRDSVLTSGDVNTIANAPEQYKKMAQHGIIKQRLNGFITNLYLSTDNTAFSTAILAPSSLLRVGIMLAQILQNEAKYEPEVKVITGDAGTVEVQGEKKITLMDNLKTYVFSGSLTNILGGLYRLIMPWLLLLPVIIIIVEYIITILEYYLVTAIGIIFVPCLFLDFTKHYAKNLITLFLNYFFKLMITTIICYYCLANVLITGRVLVAQGDFTLMTIGYATFQFILAMTLAHTGPRMAMALISGQPSSNGGDVASTVRSMTHGAMTAGRLAGQARRAAGHAAGGVYGETAKGKQYLAEKYADKDARDTAANTTYGKKGSSAAAERVFGDMLAASGDERMKEQYGIKRKDENGKEYYATDANGHMLLNDEGKKWAQNERYSPEGREAMQEYNKGREKLVRQLARDQRRQRLAAVKRSDAVTYKGSQGYNDVQKNLNAQAQQIQDMWENNKDKPAGK